MNTLRKEIGLIGLLLAGIAFGDYNFPSAMPPAGKSPSEVKQIVTFIWDDNSYSGLSKTQYEAAPGASFASSSFIDGVKPWGNSGPNLLNLTEGMIGMSWAINTLAGIPSNPAEWSATEAYSPGSRVSYNGNIYNSGTKWPGLGEFPEETSWNPWVLEGPVNTTRTRTNPDGSDLHFTFNVISGLMIPIWGLGWESYESKYGYFKPNEAFYADGTVLHTKVSVSWGREMYAYVGASSAADTATVAATPGSRQGGQINEVFLKTIELGHEVGNHTIDHMESNSPLPYAVGNPYKGNVEGEAYLDGFARWGGDGFDSTKLDTLPWGEVGDEAAEFGQVDGNPWQYMGWKMYAGKYISKDAWKGAIALSEEELDGFLGLSVAKGNLHAFRAPRLEVNSGLHYALKELGYLYDCGQEEGYEYYVDGTNFLWPYTTDNSSPNLSWQRAIGQDMSIDSMPAGLWQLPVNTMIVPEDIRPAVWANHAIIARAEAAQGVGHAPTPEDSSHWINNSGKVTGFDFNMFILWGMTKENALKTLKYNLDQRIAGNKAPMQVGCHTDYFTPIYDNATLLNDLNTPTYGLSVTNGWNTWEDRIATFEEFIDYGIGLTEPVWFLSGKETIDYIKGLIDEGYDVGDEEKTMSGNWEFFQNADLGTSTYSGTLGADLSNVQVNVGQENETSGEYPDAGFVKYESAGYFSGLTHLSLDYKTTHPLVVRLVMSDFSSVEVVLSNLNTDVHSGMIPLEAFHENQYKEGGFSSLNGVTAHTAINTDNIVGIEVQTQTSGKAAEAVTVSLSNLKVYTGLSSPVMAVNAQKAYQGLAVRSITPSNLALDMPLAGQYTVRLLSVNGRVVKSFDDVQLSRGLNSLKLNSLSRGMYMVNIRSNATGFQKTVKAVIR